MLRNLTIKEAQDKAETQSRARLEEKDAREPREIAETIAVTEVTSEVVAIQTVSSIRMNVDRAEVPDFMIEITRNPLPVAEWK